jgi:hypothetical protein
MDVDIRNISKNIGAYDPSPHWSYEATAVGILGTGMACYMEYLPGDSISE